MEVRLAFHGAAGTDGLSGHADREELLQWVESAPTPPRLVFVVHGEPDGAASLARALRRRSRLHTLIPHLGDEYDLLSLLDGS